MTNSENLKPKTDTSLIIYCDGASRGNPGPASSAFVAVDQNKQIIHQAGEYLGKTTNNVAEYQAVILALQWIRNTHLKLKIQNSKLNLDSELLYKQIIGEYKVKALHLKPMHAEIIELISQLQSRGATIKFQHQLRDKNKLADQLANQILDNQAQK